MRLIFYIIAGCFSQMVFGQYLDVGHVTTNHNPKLVQPQIIEKHSVIIHQLSSINGADPSHSRVLGRSDDNFSVFVEEEKSKDSEVWHVNERIDYLIGSRFLYQEGLPSRLAAKFGALYVSQKNKKQWHQVQFSVPDSSDFSSPVVLANLQSKNSKRPAHIRIRNVTDHSFEFRIEEWDYQDGIVPEEKVGWAVFESGVYKLRNGNLSLHVGKTTTDAAKPGVFHSIPVDSSVLQSSGKRALFAQTQTIAGNQAVVVRKRLHNGNLEVQMQEQENLRNSGHAEETIGFVFVGRETQNAITTYTRPIKFILEDAFLLQQTDSEIRQNLIGYVEDLNKVFAKSTMRRFSFNPETGVEYVPASEFFSGGICYPYDIKNLTYVAMIRTSTRTVSFGGNGGCNFWNDDSIFSYNLNWLRIYSRSEIELEELPALSQFEDYGKRQMRPLIHELGHAHGLASGEYYALINTRDGTNHLPDLSIAAGTPSDHYWSQRRLVPSLDPMASGQVLETMQFSPHSSNIINMSASTHSPYDESPSPTQPFSVKDENKRVDVQVVDAQTGQPVSGCGVVAFRQNPLYSSTYVDDFDLISSSTGNEQGMSSFDLRGYVRHGNFYLLALFKAQCVGYKPGGEALSLFDLQAAQYMPGGGVEGDFHYNGKLTIRVTPL